METLDLIVSAVLTTAVGTWLVFYTKGRHDDTKQTIREVKDDLQARIDRLEDRLDGRMSRVEVRMDLLQGAFLTMQSDLNRFAIAMGVHPEAETGG
ncbi:MAG: hypothetical protein ACRDH6_03220 [Actinomycetota bacterium]